MKKSLLSILALAVFATGCQNYDDQFDSLNKQITALTSKVDNLNPATAADISAITGQLTTLKGLVDAMTAQNATDLASALAKIAEITAALEALDTKVASDIAGVETSVASVTAALADTASEADVAALQSVTNLQTELDIIKAALDGLLSSGASLKRDIVISSSAELNLAESLIDASNTADYIIEGNVHIDLTTASNYGGTASLTAAVARVSALTAKLGTVLGQVTTTTASSSAALNMDKLTYVKGGFNVSGKMPSVSALATTGSLTLDLDEATISIPSLVSAGVISIDMTSVVTVTSIQLANVASTDAATTGTGVFNAPNADVNLGTAGLPAAVSVGSLIGGGTTYTGYVTTTGNISLSAATLGTVTITSGGNVDLTGTGTISGTTITASGTVNSDHGTATGTIVITAGGQVDMDATTSDAMTINAALGASAINLTSLTHRNSISGVLNLTGSSIDLSALTSNTAAMTVVSATSLSLDKMTAATASITGADVATFSAETLTLTASDTINIKALSTITIGSLEPVTNVSYTINPGDAGTLIIKAQNAAHDFNVVDYFQSLATLKVTGKANAAPASQANAITVGSMNVSLSLVEMDGVISAFTANNAPITSLTTAGKIRAFTVSGTTITALTFGHEHIAPGDASSIDITNTKIQSLDMSASTNFKVDNMYISDNISLTTIKMPGIGALPEPTAAISLTIHDNALTGIWTASVSGTGTTSYTEGGLSGTIGIEGASTFISALASQTGRSAGTVLYAIEIDAATTSMTANQDVDKRLIAGNNQTKVHFPFGASAPVAAGAELIDTAQELTLLPN